MAPEPGGPARELRIPLVSNQPQHNILWRVIDAEVDPTCRELGISQIVWSPPAQGVLTGQYQPAQEPPPGSRATADKGGSEMVARRLRDDVLTRVQQLRPLAYEAGLTMTTMALARVLHNPNVSAAIIGASRPDQVTHNARAADVTLDRPAADTASEAPCRRVPTVTVVIDTPERIGRAFPVIDALTHERGLVTSELVPAARSTSGRRGEGGLDLATQTW